MDLVEEEEGKLCLSNKDCPISSCCSQNQCQKGLYCLSGVKTMNDVCDWAYECGSRCCKENKCDKPINCMQVCKTNEDCDNNAYYDKNKGKLE